VVFLEVPAKGTHERFGPIPVSEIKTDSPALPLGIRNLKSHCWHKTTWDWCSHRHEADLPTFKEKEFGHECRYEQFSGVES